MENILTWKGDPLFMVANSHPHSSLAWSQLPLRPLHFLHPLHLLPANRAFILHTDDINKPDTSVGHKEKVIAGQGRHMVRQGHVWFDHSSGIEQIRPGWQRSQVKRNLMRSGMSGGFLFTLQKGYRCGQVVKDVQYFFWRVAEAPRYVDDFVTFYRSFSCSFYIRFPRQNTHGAGCGQTVKGPSTANNIRIFTEWKMTCRFLGLSPNAYN